MVASLWSGYIFQTKAKPYPGFEADYGLAIAEKLTLQQRVRYHVLSPAEVESNFAAHVPRIVVVGNQYSLGDRMRYTAETSLRAHEYTLVRSIGDTSIYVYYSKP
jgi:hypothetical protein